jgi:sugar lactone lactonase YvrE
MLRKLLIASLLILIAFDAAIRLRYGGGETYRDLNTPPVLPNSAMDIAAQYHEPIGNVAASADGRLFFTVHPESRPEIDKLMEWRDGKAMPFPDRASQASLNTPLGLTIDTQGRLWVIDHGNHGIQGAQLLSFDLRNNRLIQRHAFAEDIAPLGSFLQDLRVSPDANTVVIADVSFWRKRPALVIHDIASGRDRRLLESHPSVSPQDWIVRTPSKTMVFFGGLAALKPGVDGVAVSPDGRWVYYAAMTHDGLFRIPLADVRDQTQTAESLAAKVERVSDKPLSDGLSVDGEGNVLITDVEHQSVMRWHADSGKLETLIRDPRIRWSDGFSHGPNGWLYLADSAIPEQMLRSKAHIASQAPYTIWRIKTDRPGVPGQ